MHGALACYVTEPGTAAEAGLMQAAAVLWATPCSVHITVGLQEHLHQQFVATER